MHYKRIIFLALISITLFACNNEPAIDSTIDEVVSDSESLSSDLVNNPNSSENADVTNAGRLVFTDTIHDFGDLQDGEIVTYDFEYENVGKKEILITKAKGSCGCTVPEWDKAPIPPGGKGTMKVTFNSKGRPGYNEKKVLITTSGLPRDYQLIILSKVK